MPLIDTLEDRFTQKMVGRMPRNPLDERLLSFARWLSPGFPDRGWKTTDRYSLSIYLHCALRSITRLSLAYYTFWIVATIWIGFQLWHSCPVMFHPGKMQAHIWHNVWPSVRQDLINKGFIILPFVPLAWALFALILWLPRVLFWNRRARRLQGTGEIASVQEVAETAALDTSVWPPPPRLKV